MGAGPVLITGGSGQLARALAASAGVRAARLVGRPDFDFDAPDGLERKLRTIAPSLVINAAAYTAVDKAESDEAAAMRANCDGPALLGAYCAEAGIPLIHVSTDYVFDGTKGAPYVEDDPTGPTGVYGRTKLAGEQAVLASGARAVVLRTSWVYAATGRNFVLTMLNLAARTSQLRVVADQIGCPTAATDLAQAIWGVADRIRIDGWDTALGGVFHAAGSGWTSWHGLACSVFAAAERYGLAPPSVAAITTTEYPTPARRPADSRLDCGKLATVFGLRLPDWQDAVRRTVNEVYARQLAASTTLPPV